MQIKFHNLLFPWPHPCNPWANIYCSLLDYLSIESLPRKVEALSITAHKSINETTTYFSLFRSLKVKAAHSEVLTEYPLDALLQVSRRFANHVLNDISIILKISFNSRCSTYKISNKLDQTKINKISYSCTNLKTKLSHKSLVKNEQYSKEERKIKTLT